MKEISERIHGTLMGVCSQEIQPTDNSDPTFDCVTASSYFTNMCSDGTVTYGDCLPSWVSDRLFNVESITPSLLCDVVP